MNYFLRHFVSYKKHHPVPRPKNILRNTENKWDLMRNLRILNFYSKFIKNLHVDSKHFYELVRDDVPFKKSKDHEKMFQNIWHRIREENIVAVRNPKHPFPIHVDFSSIDTGSILVQQFPCGRRIAQFNSRVFTKDERKMSTLHRELCRIIIALPNREPLIIGSSNPNKAFCDHKAPLHIWAKKEDCFKNSLVTKWFYENH